MYTCKYPLLLLLCLLSYSAYSQAWIKRANVPNALDEGSGASAGGKGFISCGTGNAQYVFDTLTRQWKQTSPMPTPSGRSGGFSESANGKIYYGLGHCVAATTSCEKAVYEYNPATDTWTTMSPFPGTGRWLPGSFAINNKIYVSCGQPRASGNLSDLWEFNPVTDTWTQKASLPSIGRYGVSGFALNGLGYIIGSATDNIWQYNPANNSWTQKANAPFKFNQVGAAFALGNYAYFLDGCGVTDTSFFWRYNPVADTWTKLAHPLPYRSVPVGFSINNRGFVGTGQGWVKVGTNYFWTLLSDFWEYNPDCNADMINELSITNYQPYYCDTVHIDSIKAYTVAYNPTTYLWLKSTDGVNYSAVPGGNTPNLLNISLNDTAYYKRVVTQNAQCFDTSQAIALNVNKVLHDATIDSITGTAVCEGDTVILRGNGTFSWVGSGRWWYLNNVPYKFFDTILRTTTSGYYKIVSDIDGCPNVSDSIKVKVSPLPQPTISHYGMNADTLMCDSNYAFYQWKEYHHDTLMPGATQKTFIPADTGWYYVEVTDSNGCPGKSLPWYSTPLYVHSEDLQHGISFYPNPASTLLYIHSRQNMFDIFIYNMTSSVEKHINIHKGLNIIDLQSLELPTGFYIISYSVKEVFYYEKLSIIR